MITKLTKQPVERCAAEVDPHTGIVRRIIVGDAGWAMSAIGGQWYDAATDGSIGKNYPAIGDTFDTQRKAFIAPKPDPAAVLDEAAARWITPNPKDGSTFNRDEWRWEVAEEAPDVLDATA